MYLPLLITKVTLPWKSTTGGFWPNRWMLPTSRGWTNGAAKDKAILRIKQKISNHRILLQIWRFCCTETNRNAIDCKTNFFVAQKRIALRFISVQQKKTGFTIAMRFVAKKILKILLRRIAMQFVFFLMSRHGSLCNSDAQIMTFCGAQMSK